MENFEDFSKKFERYHGKTYMKFEENLSEFSITILVDFKEILKKLYELGKDSLKLKGKF